MCRLTVGQNLCFVIQQVVKELVSATPSPALQSKTRLGQTPLYLAAYWVSLVRLSVSASTRALLFLAGF